MPITISEINIFVKNIEKIFNKEMKFIQKEYFYSSNIIVLSNLGFSVSNDAHHYSQVNFICASFKWGSFKDDALTQELKLPEALKLSKTNQNILPNPVLEQYFLYSQY